jgi:hypothetical protein
MSTNKKELMLPADTFSALTARLHRQREELDLAQARLEGINALKADHEKAKRSWEKFHYSVQTPRDSLSREARESQELAFALLSVEEALDAIRSRGEWYSEESSRLHAQYLTASSAASIIGMEVAMLESILYRAGAVEGELIEE